MVWSRRNTAWSRSVGGGTIMSNQPNVNIVMATFNGAPYLVDQIESILAQTFSGWRLLVRDDGSTDATPGIIRDYARRHPGRLSIVDPQGEALGASLNF